MIKTSAAVAANPTQSNDLLAAAASAIAADNAEDEVARKQAHAQGFDRRETDSHLQWRWVERVSPFIRALSEPTRLKVVSLLAENEPREVGALAKELKVQSSTMSQHLSMLRDTRIIVMVKEGVRTKCYLNRKFLSWRLQQIATRLKVGAR